MSVISKNSVRITVLFLLLLIPIFYALFAAIDLEYSWLKKTAYFVVVLLLLLIPALFFKARTYFILEGIFNFFFFPIDVASIYLNRQPTSTAFLENIFQTDIHESLELLISLWPICILVIFLWIIYFVLSFRVENKYLLTPFLRKTVLIGLPSAFAIGMLAMLLLLTRVHGERSVKSTLIDAIDMVWIKLYKIYPYNLYIESAKILQNTIQKSQMQKEVENFSFGIQAQPTDSSSLYILVIGETARYDHFGINGYARSTTPLLSQTSHLISYDSAFSQANLTSYSVPLILTRATARDPQTAYKEKSLPEAFQEAGFRAGYISKQIPSLLVRRIMDRCDDALYDAKDMDVNGSYDIDIVDILREMTYDTAQFFVLHSLGCHFRYELRYPSEFAIFQPTLGTTFSYSMITEENKEKLINSYDNAIYYTDYFLSSLIHYMDSLNRPAVMVYMSDHGESFWDDERKMSLHGSYQISEYEYHVPLIVWYSDEYMALYPEKVSCIQQNKTTPVSSDVIFYSLLDLANIEFAVDSTRSICSPYLSSMDTIWVHTGSGDVEKWGIPRP